MSLKDRLSEDLKIAMKEKDSVKKNIVTMVRAQIKQYEVDNRTEADDVQIQQVVSKLLKQTKDSLEDFKKGAREDLISQAEREIEILLTYLPEQLSDEELTQIIKDAISSTGASNLGDMGKVMGAVMPKVKGKADGTKINEIVKSILG